VTVDVEATVQSMSILGFRRGKLIEFSQPLTSDSRTQSQAFSAAAVPSTHLHSGDQETTTL